MRSTVLVITLGLALPATPLAAQDEGPDRMGEGMDLMQRGMGLMFQGMMQEMGPQIAQMKKLAELLDNWEDYQMPEVLPNGDILIRKKTPDAEPRSEPDGTDGPGDDGKIDL